MAPRHNGHPDGTGASAGESAGALRLPRSAAAALIAGLATCAVLGVSAWPLRTLLHAAAVAAGGI